MRISARAKTIGAISASLACAFFSAGLASAIDKHGLGSSDAAGWVQAIGSIAAIIGAFAIANRQYEDNLRMRREEDHRNLSQRCEIVKGILQKVHARLMIVDLGRSSTPFNVVKKEDTDLLRATAKLVDSLSPFNMPSTSVLAKCFVISDSVGIVANLLDKDYTLFEQAGNRFEGVQKSMDDLAGLLQDAIAQCDAISGAQL